MSLARARVSVTGTFFLNGAVFSSWYARLPSIQERLELSPGELGIALLGAPVGLLVAQPVIGALAARVGSRPIVAAAPLYLGAVVLPALAIDTATLLLAVVVVGAANGVLDIAMNAQGLAVERASGRRLFSSLHAAFSFGALAGAVFAAAATAAEVAPLAHLATSAVLGAALGAALAPGLMRDRGNPHAARFARPSRRLAALGVIAFCALLAEGAVFDWSGVYLSTQAGASAALAPLGLAAFSLFMGAGRLGRIASPPASARRRSRAAARCSPRSASALRSGWRPRPRRSSGSRSWAWASRPSSRSRCAPPASQASTPLPVSPPSLPSAMADSSPARP